jgi:hypothetical protein
VSRGVEPSPAFAKNTGPTRQRVRAFLPSDVAWTTGTTHHDPNVVLIPLLATRLDTSSPCRRSAPPPPPATPSKVAVAEDSEFALPTAKSAQVEVSFCVIVKGALSSVISGITGLTRARRLAEIRAQLVYLSLVERVDYGQ